MSETVYSSVTIETIDQAIKDWFDKTVDAHVQSQAGGSKKVPVILASGERWITSRTKKGLRDKNGVLILPIISVRRTGIEPDVTMQALGTETATLQISKKIDPITNDYKNALAKRIGGLKTSHARAVYQVTTIPFPDRSVMSYELVVQAQYAQHMNSILEKMFHELDLNKSFVAPLDNYNRHPQIGVQFDQRTKTDFAYVVGFMDSALNDGGNLEEFTDQERIVKYSTNIRVPTVLTLDPEGEKPSVQTETTAFSLSFGHEDVRFVDDPAELDKIFGQKK